MIDFWAPTSLEEHNALQPLRPSNSDFVVVSHGDAATYLGAYLTRYTSLTGLWFVLHHGYHPSLIAKSLATLSHLGQFSSVAIEGENAAAALSVIVALMTRDQVAMESPFGDLHDAVNRPQPAFPISFFVGRRQNGEALVAPFVEAM